MNTSRQPERKLGVSAVSTTAMEIPTRVLVFVLAIVPAKGLIGYDCTGKGLNITTFSFTDIGDCSIEDIEPT